ncbi:hypothetical protein [Agromyces sp. H66]|uniref:hypothetical protein n=1 Tax=Agromyces sp. H66 TaxID=2529859 RepID=UPI0010AA56B7|nr:hypothetical protein [Agromyces sp. H66]
MGSIAERRDRVTLALGAIVVAVGLCLTGCSIAEYDGVLARQIGALKDPLMRSISDWEKVGAEQDAFVDDVMTEGGAVPGAYWDGTSDPMALALNQGGTVLYDLRDTDRGLVVFDVLLAPGPRDAKSDRFVSAGEPYFGPPSIYVFLDHRRVPGRSVCRLEPEQEWITGGGSRLRSGTRRHLGPGSQRRAGSRVRWLGQPARDFAMTGPPAARGIPMHAGSASGRARGDQLALVGKWYSRFGPPTPRCIPGERFLWWPSRCT